MSLSFKQYMRTEAGHVPGQQVVQQPGAVMAHWVGATKQCAPSTGTHWRQLITTATERGVISAEANKDTRSRESLQSRYFLLVALELLTPCLHTVLEEEWRISERGKCPDWDFKLT